MQYTRRFWRDKNSVHISLILKLLLKRKEFESVLHQKVASRRYTSNGVSLESFRQESWKNSRCHSSFAAQLSKLI